MELLHCAGTLVPADAKTYRQYRFVVPPDAGELEIRFAYDPGGPSPHSLVCLGLFDPHGFRGAGHRFRPQQIIRIGPQAATPGFLPGPLMPGEWTVELDIFWAVARPGGAPAPYTLSVEARPAPPEPAAVPVPRPSSARPATSGPGWYRGELHLHTHHSDAGWSPGELAAALLERGLDFAALTDHNTTSGLAEMLARETKDLLIIPGMELTTFSGHALALGSERWTNWRTGLDGWTIDDAARAVRGAGALFIVAHPQAPPDEICTGCRWAYPEFDPALAQAVEVWSGRWDNPDGTNPGCLMRWQAWLNAGHRLAAVGATDAHGPQHWQGAPPQTRVYAEALTAPAILEGIRRGHTYVSSGPSLHLGAVGEDGRRAMMGDGVPGRPEPMLEVSWRDSPAAMLRLVGSGQVRHALPVRGEGEARFAARSGDRWCAAELWSEAGDTLLAVTSPLYL